MKARYPDMPVLVLSAHTETDAALTAIREGTLFDSPIKPVEPPILDLAIDRALEFVHLRAIARESDQVTAMRELAVTAADRVLNPLAAATLVGRRLRDGVDPATGALLAQRLEQMIREIRDVVQQMTRIFRYAPGTIHGSLRQIDLAKAAAPPPEDDATPAAGPIPGPPR